MNTSVKMVLVLTLVSVVAGGLLQAWEGVTVPIIEKYRAEQLQKAVTEVLPEHDSYDTVEKNGVTLYLAKKNGVEEPVGVAFNAKGPGFQSILSIMVGMTTDYATITGIKVLEQVETPGLGTKIEVDPSNDNPFWFSQQYKGKAPKYEGEKPVITVLKNQTPSNPDEIMAITGATISSKAMTRIINEAIDKARVAAGAPVPSAKPAEAAGEETLMEKVVKTGTEALQKGGL